MKAAQNIRASTQKFIEIQDIREDVALLGGNTACMVIEVQASNFTLLSKEEQEGKIYAYAALLNSLSFPIQVLIRNKRIDISSYLKLLDAQVGQTQNEKLALQIRLYRDFVQELVKINVVLDKNFYIVVSYSPLEKGVIGATNYSTGKNAEFTGTQAALHTKADAVHAQLARLNLRAKTLQKEELIKLFYSMFNDDFIDTADIADSMKAPMVTTQNIA